MTFSPSRSPIASITQANPCVVTTSVKHNLTTGQIVRLHVPKNYGMFPLNNNTYSAVILSPTSFSVYYSLIPPALSVNSLQYPAFSIPATPQQLTAEVLAVGSGPTPLTNTPVQVLNNTCVDTIEDATTNIATVNQPY